jgi:group I intron endonuclease
MFLKKDRYNIIKDHKYNKSGIYILYNKINDHYYVGSSINIGGRMKNYLNINFLKRDKNKNMLINKALLKHGYDNFALLVVEYLPEPLLVERETFWIKCLNPYYNILLDAYRSTDYKHTEETKKIMKIKATGKIHLKSTKFLISELLKGERNPFFKKKHSLYSKNLISIGKSSKLIFLYDSLRNLQISVSSLSLLAKEIQANYKTLNYYLNNNILFRGNWYIRDSLFNKDDVPSIIDEESFKKLKVDIINKAYIKQAIFVFDSRSKKFIRKYDGIIEAEKDLKIRHETIKNSIVNNKPIGNYIFSYHRIFEEPKK